jgi:hypothetical protein
MADFQRMPGTFPCFVWTLLRVLGPRTLGTVLFLGAGVALLGVERNARAASSREAPAWELWTGEQRIWRFSSKISKFSLGGPALRATRLSGHSPAASSPSPQNSTPDTDALLVRGQQAGAADLWVWLSDGTTEFRRIRVLPSPSGRGRRAANSPPSGEPGGSALHEALERLEEVEALPTNGGALLRGQVRSLEEEARISSLLQGFPGAILNETQLSPTLLDSAEASLRTLVADFPELRLEKIPGNLRVSGSIEDPVRRAGLARVLRQRLGRVELDLRGLPDQAPVVRFRVFLIELRKTAFRKLGVHGHELLPLKVQGRLLEGKLPLQFQSESHWDLLLQALESEGEARVLSRPELVVRAPGEAELFAGGEIPIRTHTQFNSQVNWKNFGLLFRLKVLNASDSRVRLELQSELSRLDPTLSLDAVPGIQANRLKTEVDATLGEPLFLSGLFREELKTMARGLPGLRSLPILGPLFGSEDFLSERSELVTLLIPSSGKSGPPASTLPKRPEPEELLKPEELPAPLAAAGRTGAGISPRHSPFLQKAHQKIGLRGVRR